MRAILWKLSGREDQIQWTVAKAKFSAGRWVVVFLLVQMWTLSLLPDCFPFWIKLFAVGQNKIFNRSSRMSEMFADGLRCSPTVFDCRRWSLCDVGDWLQHMRTRLKLYRRSLAIIGSHRRPSRRKQKFISCDITDYLRHMRTTISREQSQTRSATYQALIGDRRRHMRTGL